MIRTLLILFYDVIIEIVFKYEVIRQKTLGFHFLNQVLSLKDVDSKY